MSRNVSETLDPDSKKGEGEGEGQTLILNAGDKFKQKRWGHVIFFVVKLFFIYYNL